MAKTVLIFMFFICNLFSIEKWESTNLIWNFGIINSCDIKDLDFPREFFKKDPSFDVSKYRRVQKGDTVWIQPRFVTLFCEEVLPTIRDSFVLVVSDGDESFPSDCIDSDAFKGLLENEYVQHIFAQNCDYDGVSKKISRIPIGIDFHTVAYKGANGGWGIQGTPREQERLLLDLVRKSLPTSQRKCRAFIDFQHSDTMRAGFKRHLQFGEDRTKIFGTLLRSGVIDYSSWMNRADLWKKKVGYAFSVSPPGNGLDCHRTWEDLALGCIVIVKSSPLNPLYIGLPVVVVQDWTEINQENLNKWLRQYGDVSRKKCYRERLTNAYWKKEIKEKSKSIF